MTITDQGPLNSRIKTEETELWTGLPVGGMFTKQRVGKWEGLGAADAYVVYSMPLATAALAYRLCKPSPAKARRCWRPSTTHHRIMTLYTRLMDLTRLEWLNGATRLVCICQWRTDGIQNRTR